MRESLDCTCLLSVVRLNLTNTGLKAINSSFAGLSRLTALYLDDNSILTGHMLITCLSHDIFLLYHYMHVYNLDSV